MKETHFSKFKKSESSIKPKRFNLINTLMNSWRSKDEIKTPKNDSLANNNIVK